MARMPGFSAGAVAPVVPDMVADGSLAIAGPVRSSVVRLAAKRTAACFTVETSFLTGNRSTRLSASGRHMLAFFLSAPGPVSGDGLEQRRRHGAHITVAAADDTFLDLFDRRRRAARSVVVREQGDALARGRKRLAVLVGLVDEQ